MTRRTRQISDDLYGYMLEVGIREPDILTQLRAETALLENASYQISPEQGQFMTLLADTIGAKHYLEVGTFTGYSALALALALPDDGKVITCDANEEWTAIAQRYWDKAGVVAKIELRMGQAVDSLAAIEQECQPGSFDFAFIDADKSRYDTYYESALRLVRPGGLILLDNMLWYGAVIDTKDQRRNTKAIRALNLKIQADDRVAFSLLPVADGLTVCHVRE